MNQNCFRNSFTTPTRNRLFGVNRSLKICKTNWNVKFSALPSSHHSFAIEMLEDMYFFCFTLQLMLFMLILSLCYSCDAFFHEKALFAPHSLRVLLLLKTFDASVFFIRGAMKNITIFSIEELINGFRNKSN